MRIDSPPEWSGWELRWPDGLESAPWPSAKRFRLSLAVSRRARLNRGLVDWFGADRLLEIRVWVKTFRPDRRRPLVPRRRLLLRCVDYIHMLNTHWLGVHLAADCIMRWAWSKEGGLLACLVHVPERVQGSKACKWARDQGSKAPREAWPE